MHLFGLNWQLQESEGYGAFENGGGGRDTTPNTFIVSTDNSESRLKEFFLPFLLTLKTIKAVEKLKAGGAVRQET